MVLFHGLKLSFECIEDICAWNGHLCVLHIYIFINARVVLQEGFSRLWRGTNAGLALAVPTVGSQVNQQWLFNYWTLCLKAKELTDMTFICLNQVGIYLPCYDILRNWLEEFTAKNAPTTTTYVPLVAGSLARSLACATCYPIELARTRMQVFVR